jgi:hypothetical protein
MVFLADFKNFDANKFGYAHVHENLQCEWNLKFEYLLFCSFGFSNVKFKFEFSAS